MRLCRGTVAAPNTYVECLELSVALLWNGFTVPERTTATVLKNEGHLIEGFYRVPTVGNIKAGTEKTVPWLIVVLERSRGEGAPCKPGRDWELQCAAPDLYAASLVCSSQRT